MAGITFDKRITDSEEEVGIPEIVRYKTQRLLRYAKRITIEGQKPDGKFAKANGFKLTAVKDNDDYPEEEVEEVCEAIMRAINEKFRERKAVDENMTSMGFRVVFDQRTENGRERPAIDLPDYQPDGPDLPIGFGFNGGDREGSPIETALEQMGSLVDKLMLRCDGLIGHIVTMSDQSKDMFDPLVRMMSIAHQNQIVGMEMQRRAMEYIYSTKRIEEEELGKERRAEKWMDFLKTPAKTAVQQFGRYMAAKAGAKVPDEADEDADEGKPKTKRGAKQRTGEGSTAAAEGDTPPPMEHPVAEFTQALGQLLRPKQWAQASNILTKKQVELFSSLFECETDDECVAVFDEIEHGGIPMMKMIALAGILDTQQQEGLEKLRELVKRHHEGWADDDPPSGADEDKPEADARD